MDLELTDAEIPLGVEAVAGDRTNFLGTLLGVGETKGLKVHSVFSRPRPELEGTTA